MSIIPYTFHTFHDNRPLFFNERGTRGSLLYEKKKASELNNIAVEVHRLGFHRLPDLLFGALNACLDDGILPRYE